MSPPDPPPPSIDLAAINNPHKEMEESRRLAAEPSCSLSSRNPGLPSAIECLNMIAAVFETSADHIMLLTPEGLIRRINKAGAEAFGKTPAEMINKKIADFIAPQLAAKRIEALSQAISSGQYIHFEDEYNGVSYAHRLFPYADPDSGETHVVTMTTDDTEEKKTRQALNKNKNRYKAILDQVELVCCWLPDLTMTYANDGFCRFFNIKNIKVEGLNLLDFVPPDARKTIISMAEELVVHPRRMIVENKIIDHNGQAHWIEWSNSPIQDDHGAVVEFQSVGLEVTKHRNTEKALRESEARYKAIVEDQDELICRYLPGGELSYVNSAYARYYKRAPEDMIGSRFLPHIPEPDIANVLKHIYSLSHEHPVTVYKNRIIHDNGEIGWQQWTLRGIYNQNSRDPVEYQTVGRDITKQELADQALAQQRSFLRLVIDTLPNLIFVLDKEGKIVLASKAMADLCGRRQEELFGQRMETICPNPDDGVAFMREISEVYSTGGMVIRPEQYLTNAKNERRCFNIIVLLLDDNARVLGMATDITDRIQAEQEHAKLERQLHKEQKLQAMGTMAGGIAHDFNNMLFAIHGYIRLALKQAEGPGKISVYLLQIQQAAHKASALVRQLLLFTHQTPHERIPLHLTDVLREVKNLLQPNLPESVKIILTLETENDTIFADPTQINQLFMNLCINAVQAMKDSGGLLNITMSEAPAPASLYEQYPDQQENTLLKIMVQDSGCGIDPSLAEKIFDPFFSTKRPGEGTGMGLAVVDGIIKNHRGYITVTSKLGQGSTFTVYLPKADQSADN